MDNEWIQIDLPYGPLYESSPREPLPESLSSVQRELDSFVARGLNIAGTLIRVRGVYGDILIGHINKWRGDCDHCCDIGTDDIVQSYKVIWRPSTP